MNSTLLHCLFEFRIKKGVAKDLKKVFLVGIDKFLSKYFLVCFQSYIFVYNFGIK